MKTISFGIENRAETAYNANQSKSNADQSKKIIDVNAYIAKTLGVPTNEDIVEDVKEKFNSFIGTKRHAKDLKLVNCTYIGNVTSLCDLESDNFGTFKVTEKAGMFKLTLNDNVAYAYFRLESRDRNLRDLLESLLKSSNNPDIKLNKGSKHTALGFRTTRKVQEITADRLYQDLVCIYNLIEPHLI